ncbi:MAG: hypothetical protein ACP5IT_10645 [Thermoproteota archaeon]
MSNKTFSKKNEEKKALQVTVALSDLGIDFNYEEFYEKLQERSLKKGDVYQPKFQAGGSGPSESQGTFSFEIKGFEGYKIQVSSKGTMNITFPEELSNGELFFKLSEILFEECKSSSSSSEEIGIKLLYATFLPVPEELTGMKTTMQIFKPSFLINEVIKMLEEVLESLDKILGECQELIELTEKDKEYERLKKDKAFENFEEKFRFIHVELWLLEKRLQRRKEDYEDLKKKLSS